MVGRKTSNLAVFFLLGCLLITGCATTKKIAGDIMGKSRDLKKKIAFLPTLSTSSYGGEDFRKAAGTELRSFLGRSCEGLCIMDSRKIREASKEMPRIESGRIDHLALAEFGRIHGLSAVVEQGISEVQCVTNKRGIWGFRKTCLLARVSFRVRAYDIETTSMLFDELVREEVEISEDAWQSVRGSNEYNKGIAHSILDKITPKIGEMICRRSAEVPWRGYIISSSDGIFTLSAGIDVGLAAGDILEVFAMGEPVKGHGDGVYFISGPKIGEIKVTEVRSQQAEAIRISGSDLENSCCIKLKP